jgi:hypothetical protein
VKTFEPITLTQNHGETRGHLLNGSQSVELSCRSETEMGAIVQISLQAF